MFALGLIELAGATADARYMTTADRILELVFEHYRGPDGLLMDLAPRLYDGPKVASLSDPVYAVEDNPHLAPSAAVAIALLRRSGLGEEEGPRARATELLARMVPRLEGTGLFGAGTALAVGLADVPAARVVIEGKGPAAEALVRAARRSWHPNAFVFAGRPLPPFSLPSELGASGGSDAPRALVCFGSRCLAPVTDPSKLAPLLRGGGREPG